MKYEVIGMSKLNIPKLANKQIVGNGNKYTLSSAQGRKRSCEAKVHKKKQKVDRQVYIRASLKEGLHFNLLKRQEKKKEKKMEKACN